jgi:hypothetical protein
MKTWPLFVRKFIVDAIETGLAALFAIVLFVPTTMDDVTQQAIVIVVALAGAVIAAFRRAVPGFVLWLRDKLGLTVDG